MPAEILGRQWFCQKVGRHHLGVEMLEDDQMFFQSIASVVQSAREVFRALMCSCSFSYLNAGLVVFKN